MLRYEHRWHDAANGPLLGEARLLCFAKRRGTPAAGGQPDDDEGDSEETEEERLARREAEELGMTDEERARNIENDVTRSGERARADTEESRRAASRQKQVDAEAEFKRRQMHAVLGGHEQEAVVPKARSLLDEARATLNDADAYAASLDTTITKVNTLRDAKKSTGKVDINSVHMAKGLIDGFKSQLSRNVQALELFDLKAWEEGDMTPSAFLVRYRGYLNQLQQIDGMNTDLTDEDRLELKESYDYFYEEARKEVQKSLQELPGKMPIDPTRQGVGATEEEMWELCTTLERQAIIKGISDASGITELKYRIADDTEVARKILHQDDIIKEKKRKIKMKDLVKMNLQAVLEAERAENSYSNAGGQTNAAEAWEMQNPFRIIQSQLVEINNALGIEWLTYNEWKAAFTEVIESVKELRKRKSIGRITRAALSIGRVAALLPGSGGGDLVNVLEEQQQKKNDDIMDDYKKELGNSRKDYGFGDLFGDQHAKEGLLKYYMRMGDMNRTRAVLEFAAGKGMLFDIEENTWQKYQFPGGYTISQLVPTEWTDPQIDSYFDNLKFMNNDGKEKSIKNGSALVKGRSNMEGYIEPFQGAVNGLSVWFAMGIANEAMSKVVDGHMSTWLTLVILDAYENNPLFRKYAPREWYDRVCGKGKQMYIGMIKYDKDMLYDNGDSPNVDFGHLPDKNKNESRLGKLTVAVREYLTDLDPSLKKDDKETKALFLKIQAMLLASQPTPLPNGKIATIYTPKLAPFHIEYYADQMRDVPVADLGDDFFIKRSEIIRGNLEVMKAVGAVTNNGFAHPVKARYMFSHIIDADQELIDLQKDRSLSDAERRDMKDAQSVLRRWTCKNLEEYVAYALKSSGADVILTEKHKDQGGRFIFPTMIQQGLVSVERIEEVARERGGAAITLLQMVVDDDATDPEIRAKADAALRQTGKKKGKK